MGLNRLEEQSAKLDRSGRFVSDPHLGLCWADFDRRQLISKVIVRLL